MGAAVAGYLVVCFGWSLEFQGRDAFVDELYVREAFRGQGLGTRALEVAADLCRASGVRALHLEVERRNTRAQDVYRRAGFVDREYYLMTRRLAPDAGPGEGPEQLSGRPSRSLGDASTRRRSIASRARSRATRRSGARVV